MREYLARKVPRRQGLIQCGGPLRFLDKRGQIGFSAHSAMENLYSKCEVGSNDSVVSFSVESCGYSATL